MVKDFFQDIVPPSSAGNPARMRRVPVAPPTSAQEDEPLSEEAAEEIAEEIVDEPLAPDRSIRNVNFTPARPRRTTAIPPQPKTFGMPRKPGSRKWMWFLAILALFVVGALALVSLRMTSVTVTPRVHAVLFDESSVFTAYPQVAAAAGTLPYTVETVELEESDSVASNGSVQASDKASGLITVFNDYSTASQRLIKNTRFEATGGLIFRAPSDIVVPGKTASGPGQVTITVVADQPGAQYNVGPVARLTLPGLKSTADMYAKIYAQSSAAFSGGFVGEKPGVAQADLDRAIAGMRSRIEGKARDAAEKLASDSVIVFPDLVQIRYEEAPSVEGAGDNVRVVQKARVSIPVFPAEMFARVVALSVSSDLDDATVSLVPGEGYGARLVSASSTYGVEALQFGLIGAADIVWQIDELALAEALSGRDQSAFQTIVTGIKGIQEARARIEPFWSGTFPSNPADIKIKVQSPVQ